MRPDLYQLSSTIHGARREATCYKQNKKKVSFTVELP